MIHIKLQMKSAWLPIHGDRVIQRDNQHIDWTLQAPTRTCQSVKNSRYNNTKRALNEYLANLSDSWIANHKGICRYTNI